MNDPLGFLIGTAWGSVTLLSWSIVLVRRYRRWQEWRDRRSRRELFIGFGLWFLAVIIAVVLFLISVRSVIDVGPAVRGVAIGVGMGCFTGVGVMAALDSRP